MYIAKYDENGRDNFIGVKITSSNANEADISKSEYNMFRNALLNNLKSHLEAYKADRISIIYDLESILKNKYYKLFNDPEFIELANQYKPFAIFINTYLEKYEQKQIEGGE